MAYVPNLPEAQSPNPLAGQEKAQQPSQTNLMMAMAQMHQLGKFTQPSGAARETTPSRNLKTLPYNRKLSPLKTQR
jgi:hypothetical protein